MELLFLRVLWSVLSLARLFFSFGVFLVVFFSSCFFNLFVKELFLFLLLFDELFLFVLLLFEEFLWCVCCWEYCFICFLKSKLECLRIFLSWFVLFICKRWVKCVMFVWEFVLFVVVVLDNLWIKLIFFYCLSLRIIFFFILKFLRMRCVWGIVSLRRSVFVFVTVLGLWWGWWFFGGFGIVICWI